MNTKKITNDILAYSSGFAVSVVLANATKTAVDSLVKNDTVKMVTTGLALVIVFAGTMTFSKMFKASLEKANPSTVVSPNPESIAV